MTKKRILSMALSGAMALSMGVPAFAADDDTTPPANQTVITGAYEEQTIAVTVPQTGTAYINPYGLNIALDENDDTVAIKGQQIVTLPLTVTNKSAMNLSVSASVTGAVDGNFKFATASTKGTPDKDPDAEDYVAPKTDTSGYVVFQMKSTTLTDDTDTDAINTEATKWAYAATDKDIVLSSTKPVEGKDLVTLKAASDGEPVSGGIAMFRLAGDCVTSPKTAWAESDGFSATVAFTFIPVVK